MPDDEPRYNVYRYFRNSGHRRCIMRGVTLAVARLHCNSPQTAYNTCTTVDGKLRTARYGPWFDGYVKQGGE